MLYVRYVICCKLFLGTIHRDERPVHEERSGLRPRLLHHRPVHVQRPSRPPGTNSQGQGNFWKSG